MSLALDTARVRASAGEDTFRGEYLRALRMIERLHRLLLDVIKDEFDRQGGAEINSVQALLLNNMGDDGVVDFKTHGRHRVDTENGCFGAFCPILGQV